MVWCGVVWCGVVFWARSALNARANPRSAGRNAALPTYKNRGDRAREATPFGDPRRWPAKMPAAPVQAVFIRAIPQTLCDWSAACVAFLAMPVSESAGAFGTAVQVGVAGRRTVALAAQGAPAHEVAGT